jgi:signal transduction histidine kinase
VNGLLIVLAQLVALVLVVAGLPWAAMRVFQLGDGAELILQRVVWSLPIVATLIGLPLTVFSLAGHSRKRTLALPLRLAIAVALESVVAVGVMIALLLRAGAPTRSVVGLSAVTLVVLLLVPVAVFAAARLAIGRMALRLRDQPMPAGPRASIAAQLGYALSAIALAGLVPAAVYAGSLAEHAVFADTRARAEATARQLAEATRGLGEDAAADLVTRAGTVAFGGAVADEVALLTRSDGSKVPRESVALARGRSCVESPLPGDPTARVAVCFQPPSLDPRPLAAVTLLLLIFGVAAAVRLGRNLGAELGGVAVQIDRATRAAAGGGEASDRTRVRPSMSEVRRITRAANRILDRVPRFSVESFLAIERADEASRLKSQFLANMSHDLRSPLNSILGFSELLLRGIEGPISDGQRKELDIIQERGHHLLRQLNAILDTAKMESGRMELHRQTVPPAELVRAAVQEAKRGRPPAAVSRVDVELLPGLQPMHVDPLRVTQMLTHLVNYGLDSTSGRVVLRVRDGQDNLGRILVAELEVDSTVDPKQLAKLFDSFAAVGDGAPRPGGLSLALPLARRLVELHAGGLAADGKAAAGKLRLKATVPTSARAARN